MLYIIRVFFIPHASSVNVCTRSADAALVVIVVIIEREESRVSEDKHYALANCSITFTLR